MRAAVLLTLFGLLLPQVSLAQEAPKAEPAPTAQPAAEPTAEVPATPPAAGAGSDTVVPDEDAAPLDPAAAQALEPAPEPPPAINGWSYQDGALAGSQDARIASGYGLHALGGLAAGLVCGGCGCVGAPAVEMLVSPGVPAGPWQGYDSAYQRGYIDSYRRTMRQRRAAYAFAGAGVGAATTFLVGFAYGVYGGSLDLF